MRSRVMNDLRSSWESRGEGGAATSRRRARVCGASGRVVPEGAVGVGSRVLTRSNASMASSRGVVWIVATTERAVRKNLDNFCLLKRSHRACLPAKCTLVLCADKKRGAVHLSQPSFEDCTCPHAHLQGYLAHETTSP